MGPITLKEYRVGVRWRQKYDDEKKPGYTRPFYGRKGPVKVHESTKIYSSYIVTEGLREKTERSVYNSSFRTSI